MVKFTVCFAEKIISVESVYEATRDFCRDYLSDAEDADIHIVTSPIDIEAERKKSEEERRLEGLVPYEFSKEYLETLALYRKIATALCEFGIILFHGSALSVDGEGYIFTARSGTGKSTHTRLWRKVLRERVEMINDDKPLVKISDNEITVFGTPWCGKHGIGANISAPLKAIAVLERSKENSIAEISRYEALPKLLAQTYRPKDKEALRTVLSLVDKLASILPIYRLSVNMEDEAAEVAYGKMSRADK